MSPLPEAKGCWSTYTSEREKIGRFFYADIGPEEEWVWHANLGTKRELAALIESKGVDLMSPLESDPRSREDGTTHRIFTTNESKTQGTYLELIYSFFDTRVIIDYVFHRYGESLNKQYIDSLLNG